MNKNNKVKLPSSQVSIDKFDLGRYSVKNVIALQMLLKSITKIEPFSKNNKKDMKYTYLQDLANFEKASKKSNEVSLSAKLC